MSTVSYDAYREDVVGRADVPDTPELVNYYKELAQLKTAALWTVANKIEPWQPKSDSVPVLWRYQDLREHVLRSVSLVSPEKAGRRVVYLDNPFGKEVLKDMSTALAEAQVERGGEFALAVDGKNGAELADKVAAERPGAVLLATTGTANTAFVQAFRTKAQGVPLAGLSVTVIASEMPKLAASTRGLALVQVFPDANSQKSVAVRKFQATMKAVGAEAAYLNSASALEGWLNAQIMFEGLKNAGKDLTRERLRAGLAGIRSLSFGDFSVGFGNKAPYIGSDAIYLAVYAENGRRIS